MLTTGINLAFQGKGTGVSEGTVKPDFLADGGLILTDGVRDGGFGGSVFDTGLNDPAILKSECFVFVLPSQKRPPFRQKAFLISL